MGVEIERKFLLKAGVALADVTDGVTGVELRQGYLTQTPMCVRVRLSKDQAWLTLKSTGIGIARAEFEYLVPYSEGVELFERHASLGRLSKTRYKIAHGNHVFELDQYHGALNGVVTVEVELASEDERVVLPDWVGVEVSGDIAYSNESLARNGWPV